MELDDLKLCYLFIKTGETASEEKLKALENAKTKSKLSDFEMQNFDEFCHYITDSKNAAKRLLTMLPKLKKQSKKSVGMEAFFDTMNDTLHPTYESRLRNTPERAREVLFTLIEITSCDKEQCEQDKDFINDFALRMNIDESYIHEFKDIIKTQRTLYAKRERAKDTCNSDEDSEELLKQCDADLKVLEKDINDLIQLG